MGNFRFASIVVICLAASLAACGGRRGGTGTSPPRDSGPSDGALDMGPPPDGGDVDLGTPPDGGDVDMFVPPVDGGVDMFVPPFDGGTDFGRDFGTDLGRDMGRDLGVDAGPGSTTTFSYSGTIASYVVPSGHTQVHIVADGASGSDDVHLSV